MSLLILFQNARIQLVKAILGIHFIGSVNAVELVAGGDNQVQFLGSTNALEAL